MTTPGSVSIWIEQVREGNEDALQNLWERYYLILLRSIRAKLRSRQGRRFINDEEDFVLHGFNEFYKAANAGRYPDVRDRDSLWRLLMTIVANRVRDEARFHGRKKRGGGKLLGMSALMGNTDLSTHQGFSSLIGDDPTPEFTALISESLELRLSRLNDSDLRTIAIMKMEGYRNSEIAERLDVSERTVERKISRIKKVWNETL